jgi:type VI secretion system protein ImpJ
MMPLSRVVWSEGMHLAQHHFQTQSRYFEDLVAFTLTHLYYRSYGCAGLELDAEALVNGTVSVSHARGVLPDGTPFHFPDDAPPPPLDVRELFSPTQDSHRVLLALPAFRRDQANCRLDSVDGGSDPRYTSATELVADETTGQSDRAVALARKNFRLLLDDAPLDGLVTMPIARVRRDGAGHYIYDPDYVQPCLEIGASRHLLELLGRLVEMLEAKAAALADERRRGSDNSEYASREVAGFWLTHAIHSAIGPLRHLWTTRGAHPEELYVEMARLAGALCTFSFDADARELPLYDHDQPDLCFNELDRQIRRHIEVPLPSNCIPVALSAAEPGFFRGTIPDARALARAHWFLGVRSTAGHGDTIANVPRLVKVCSAEHIVKLVQRAYPGVGLIHLPSPPTEISPRLGMDYFRVETNPPANSPGEPCWKLILDTSQIGVYVPAAIPDAEVQLSIVLDR